MMFRHGDFWVEYDINGDPIDESAEPVREDILKAESVLRGNDTRRLACLANDKMLGIALRELRLKNPYFKGKAETPERARLLLKGIKADD